MTRDQKIQAAQAMTDANIEYHRVRLEEGYVEASVFEVAMETRFNYVPKPINHTCQLWQKEIWGINKDGKLQMI